MDTPRSNTNRELLLAVVKQLKPLLDRVVFVGGCVTEMLVTDLGAAPVRGTIDVDVITDLANSSGFAIADELLRRSMGEQNFAAPPRDTADVDAITGSASYAEFVKLAEQLRKLGFNELAAEDAPICRWRSGDLILDVMPTDSSVFGFTNRWYGAAFENATTVWLDDYEIRLVTAPYFVATKLEAFHGRGQDDYQTSRDLEDIITVIDGRPELLDEISLVVPELQAYISQEFRALLEDQSFLDALPGFLRPDAASQERLGIILRRMRLLIGDQ